jgi:hypothetical protein
VLPPANVTLCLNAQQADLTAEMPSIPQNLRTSAQRILSSQLSAERRHDRRRLTPGVFLVGFERDGGGGGGGASAAAIRRQGMFMSAGTNHGAILSGIVPDGVASVTFDYPAQHHSGQHDDSKPAASVTATVLNNVIVTSIPRSAENAFGSKMTWRSANGAILRIVPANGS